LEGHYGASVKAKDLRPAASTNAKNSNHYPIRRPENFPHFLANLILCEHVIAIEDDLEGTTIIHRNIKGEFK